MELRGLFEGFKQIFTDIELKFNTINETFVKKDKELGELKKTISQLNSSISTVSKELQTYKLEQQEYITSLTEVINNNIKDAIKRSVVNNLELENKLKSIENKLSSDIKELSEDIKSNNNTHTKSIKELSINISNISFEDNFNNISEELAILSTKLKKVTTIEKTLLEHSEDINKLQAPKVNNKENVNSSKITNLNNEIDAFSDKLKRLEDIITTFKLSKRDILRTIQEEGYIDLLYNLKLTPRVLPKKVSNGTLLIDAKDGLLKYYNDKWIII